MDTLGIMNPVVLPTLPKPIRQAAPVLSQPSAPELPRVPQPGGEVSFDAQAAEQRRYEAVQKVAQDIANVYIVSDMRFTIFKDSTGQYITRFTSLRDGKVTYIPEPQLLRMSHSGASAPTVTIDA
jgi:hypothetical protein